MDSRNVAVLSASLWAVCGAMAGRELGMPGAALACLLALGYGWRSGPGPWLLAWPAALCAVTHEPHGLVPRTGPVHFEARVLPGSEHDPRRGHTLLNLAAPNGTALAGLVEGRLAALPGDRLVGVARLTGSTVPLLVCAPDGVRIKPGRPSIQRGAEAWRRTMADRLQRAVPGAPGHLLCHLVLGRGPWLPVNLVNAHRATGLTHLLAVSGAHATMLAFMIGVAFRLLAGRSPLTSRGFRRFAMVVLGFYGFLTGMEPPVFRALVATFVFLACSGADRRTPIFAALATPALLTALLLPRDLFSVSFNLSYAAVFGLSISGAFGSGPKSLWQRYLWTPFWASVWATLTTMPFTLWAFGQIAPWTILLTPICAPLVGLMLAGGLMVGVCGLPILTPLLAAPTWLCTWLYSSIVEAAALLPWAPVHAWSRPDALTACAWGLPALALLCILRNRTGIAVLCLCLGAPHFLQSGQPHTANLQLLAVGHGQACLLRMPSGARVLVDCGSLGEGRRAKARVIRALLPARRLDLLVVTHGDADHISGLPDLLQQVPVRQALLPASMLGDETHALLVGHGCRVTFARTGLQPALAGITVWAPAEGDADVSRNDRSLWVRAELGTFTALLCGDALEAGTAEYLESHREPADVLVLPHHGRRHGAIAELLSVIQPKLALASTARRDGVSAQARIAMARGIPVLHTGLSGNVTVHGDPPVVETERPLQLK